MATEQELSDFLKSVEKRAFKRSLYHVRNEEAALDIVQDSMLKLAEHYGDKPPAELPMLYQRILSNCTLDWFRRQKTRNALFSSMSDFEGPGEDGTDFDLLEAYSGPDGSERADREPPQQQFPNHHRFQGFSPSMREEGVDKLFRFRYTPRLPAWEGLSRPDHAPTQVGRFNDRPALSERPTWLKRYWGRLSSRCRLALPTRHLQSVLRSVSAV